VHLRGRVVCRVVGRGSKSEREAVLLETADGALLMRRRRGPSFGETGFEPLVGKTVACSGTIVGQTLLVDAVEE
jgi:hypothetical protein